MSEDFVREFADDVNWNFVYVRMLNLNLNSTKQYSEKFVRDFLPKNKTDWANVANKLFLSEAFMTDFADKLDFKLLSKMQHLSEDFMRKFEKKLDWKSLFKTQRMSAKFIQEFKHKIA